VTGIFTKIPVIWCLSNRYLLLDILTTKTSYFILKPKVLANFGAIVIDFTQ
jgi:hypothetical protein